MAAKSSVSCLFWLRWPSCCAGSGPLHLACSCRPNRRLASTTSAPSDTASSPSPSSHLAQVLGGRAELVQPVVVGHAPALVRYVERWLQLWSVIVQVKGIWAELAQRQSNRFVGAPREWEKWRWSCRLTAVVPGACM